MIEHIHNPEESEGNVLKYRSNLKNPSVFLLQIQLENAILKTLFTVSLKKSQMLRNKCNISQARKLEKNYQKKLRSNQRKQEEEREQGVGNRGKENKSIIFNR